MDSDEDESGPSAALDRVREELARLGADADSAPEVPAGVTARIGAALRAAPAPRRPDRTPAAHAMRGPLLQESWRVQESWRLPGRCHRLTRWIGAAAAVLAIALGTVLLLRQPASVPSASSAELTAQRITVSRTVATIPLSDAQLRALTTAAPDFGALSDPRTRTGCLRALGYPAATVVLAARPLDIDGSPGVLLVLADTAPEQMVAVVVAPRCGPDDAAALTGKRTLRR